MGMRLGSVSMMAATAVAILAFNTLSLHVSAERAKVDRLQARIAADLRDIRALEAELRTRARLPVLQTWNDNVLALSAPTARQFADSPVQLASFASPEPVAKPAAPAVQLALATPETEVVPTPGVVKATYQVAASAPVAAALPREMVITYGAADLSGSRAAPARPVATPAKVTSAAPRVVEPKKAVATPEVKKAEKPAEPIRLAEAKPKPKPPAAKPPAKPSDLDALLGAIDTAAASNGGFQKVSMQ